MDRGVFALLVGGFVGLVGLFGLAGWLVEANSSASRGALVDYQVAIWAATDAPELLKDAMRVITWGGASAIALPCLLLVSLFLRGAPGADRIGSFLVMAALGLLLSSIVKDLIDRPRPVVSPLVAAGGSSFPSGHATTGAIFFLSLAVVWSWQRPHMNRALLWGCATLGVVLVATSRVVLGVHWTTDVVAGALLGAAWVAIAWRASGENEGSRAGSFPG